MNDTAPLAQVDLHLVVICGIFFGLTWLLVDSFLWFVVPVLVVQAPLLTRMGDKRPEHLPYLVCNEIVVLCFLCLCVLAKVF